MASSSGRYQSRLFNWLSQGLGQLEIQSRIRRLKTGIAWGVQLVFYLAHGLTQRAQSTGQGLGQTLQRQLGIGTAPASSQPVQGILLEVEQSYLPAATGTIAGTTDNVLTVQQDVRSSPIRGITSLLTTRTLVLVTEQNQLLDILSPEQQKQLHHQIIWEISDYWYRVRITQAARRRLSPLQAALKGISRLIPKGLAQPMTTWLQTQPRLVSNHQPQESRFKLRSWELGLTAHSQSQLPTPSKIATALTFLDSVSSHLEQQVERIVRLAQRGLVSRQAAPDQASRGNPMSLRTLIRAAIAYFFGQKPLRSLPTSAPSLDSSTPATSSGIELQQPNPNENLVKGLSKQQGFLQKLWAHLDLTPAQKTLRAEASKIQALVRAAITYFFGRNPFLFPSSTTQAPMLDSGTAAATLTGSQQPTQSGRGRLTQGNLGQEQPWLTLADLFGGSTEIVTSPGSGAVSVSVTSGSTTDAHEEMSQGTSPGVDSNWLDIEIEAILMGYVKHPLEQVLEWLDRGLAWLEELVVTLWAHLRPYLLALFQLIRRYWQR